jgi:hypothetical protein
MQKEKEKKKKEKRKKKKNRGRFNILLFHHLLGRCLVGCCGFFQEVALLHQIPF